MVPSQKVGLRSHLYLAESEPGILHSALSFTEKDASEVPWRPAYEHNARFWSKFSSLTPWRTFSVVHYAPFSQPRWLAFSERLPGGIGTRFFFPPLRSQGLQVT